MINWPFQYVNPIITLLCNNKCPYCITRHSEKCSKKEMLKYVESPHSYVKWIEGLKNFPAETIKVFNGGEPTLFPGIENIINTFSKTSIVGLGTNLKAETSSNIIRRMKPENLKIAFSLHPMTTEGGLESYLPTERLDASIRRAIALRELGYEILFYAIKYPNIDSLYVNSLFDKYGLAGEVNKTPYLGYFNGKIVGTDGLPEDAFDGIPKKVRCRLIDPPIGPDGSIYSCAYALYTDKRDMILGNIFDGTYNGQKNVECPYYGLCNPCDFTYDRKDRAVRI